MEPSMWCSKYEKWTKEYGPTGKNTCGREADPAGIYKQPNDLQYEAKRLKNNCMLSFDQKII